MPRKKSSPNQEVMNFDETKKKTKFKFLKPKEKFQKYGKELKEGKKYTNNGEKKLDDKGNHISLTDREIGFRQGARAQYIENVEIYLRKSGKYDESKANKKLKRKR